MCENKNLATNDIILIAKILNIHNNNLVVKRGYNNTYSQPHNEGSIIILLDKPLEYSDIIHKKHFINSNNDISDTYLIMKSKKILKNKNNIISKWIIRC